MVVGVGGQGVIVAAAVIADTAMLHGGLEVKLSETRGMSQRGGSVSSHIRIGETVVAPSISPGEVDYLLAFEKAEGLRAAPSVVPGGVAIVNTQQIVPPLASQGDMSYPFDAVERIEDGGDRRVIVVDGNGIALQVGDLKVAGIVLVGALSTHLPFDVETWQAAIARNVPPKWKDLNFAAFAAGREVGRMSTTCPGGAAAGSHAVADEEREYFDPYSETLEPEDLQDLQLGRLQTVVTHSYANSAGLHARSATRPASSRRTSRSLDDIRRLPFIDKHTLRDHYPDRLRTCGLDNIIEVHSTSGTTGKPTPIWASRQDMDLWFERNARTMWMIGLRPGDLLQNMFGYGLPTSIGLQYGAQHAGIGVVPAGIGRQELLIDLIVDLGVTAICTTPSYGLYLAEKALERGIDLEQGHQAAHRPVRRRAVAGDRPRAPRRRHGRRRLQRVRHGRVPRTGHGRGVPGQAGHARVVGPHLRGVHRPGDARAGRRRRARRARVDVAHQRLDGHDPLPQPRHQLAHLRAVRVRPQPPAHRPHHRPQRRRGVRRRPRRLPQPDRGGAAAVRRVRQQLLHGHREREQPRPPDAAGRGLRPGRR